MSGWDCDPTDAGVQLRPLGAVTETRYDLREMLSELELPVFLLPHFLF